MKKTISALMAAWVLVGCTQNSMLPVETDTSSETTVLVADTDVNKSTETTTTADLDKISSMEKFVEENRVELDSVPQFVQGDLIVYSPEKALDEIPFETTFLPTYRNIYYWAPTFLIDLVGRENAGIWHNGVVQPNIDNNTEPSEMYIVSFIKYFEISKDVFEDKCEEYKIYIQKLRDENNVDITDEGYEIPNADIIYTFDNEIINNYYLRVQEKVNLTH